MMKITNYWDDFYKTGMIEDYLLFRSSNQDTFVQKMEENSNVTGDNPYARFSNHNGNSNEDSAYR